MGKMSMENHVKSLEDRLKDVVRNGEILSNHEVPFISLVFERRIGATGNKCAAGNAAAASNARSIFFFSSFSTTSMASLTYYAVSVA